MLKIGAVLAVPLVAGYLFLPQFRVAILALIPFAFYAICPISMLVGMKMIGGSKHSESCSSCETDHRKKTDNDKDEPEKKDSN